MMMTMALEIPNMKDTEAIYKLCSTYITHNPLAQAQNNGFPMGFQKKQKNNKNSRVTMYNPELRKKKMKKYKEWDHERFLNAL